MGELNAENFMPCNDFEKTFLSMITCTICFHVPVEITRLACSSCDRLYCKACITNWINTNKTCPICKKFVDINNLVKDTISSNLLDKVHYNCPNKCGWEQSYGNYAHHIKECTNLIVTCKNLGCNIETNASNMREHAKICKKAIKKCNDCKKNHLVLNIENHVCLKNKIECNLCHMFFEQNKLDDHQKLCATATHICKKCNYIMSLGEYNAHDCIELTFTKNVSTSCYESNMFKDASNTYNCLFLRIAQAASSDKWFLWIHCDKLSEGAKFCISFKLFGEIYENIQLDVLRSRQYAKASNIFFDTSYEFMLKLKNDPIKIINLSISPS